MPTTLPEEFISRTQPLFGETLWQHFVRALREPAPVSLRVNPLKFRPGAMSLPAEEDSRVAWADGIYLKERPLFTLDPLFHAGAYYVQEAASMFVAHTLRRHCQTDGPLSVLDLCAAPGGKSTALRAMLPGGSLLVSNEPDRRRANILVENILKQGHPDVIVTNGYAGDISRSGLQFDVILCDAPCSGEGMFRKDEGAVAEWSAENVARCAALQRQIIADIMPALRPGGLFIYSTCTYNEQENEQHLAPERLRELGLTLLSYTGGTPVPPRLSQYDRLPAGEPLYTMGGRCARFIPGATRSEGLFMAAMRKDASPYAADQRPQVRKPRQPKGSTPPLPKEARQLEQWLADPDEFALSTVGNKVVAVRQSWQQAFGVAMQKLRVIHAGVELAVQKGRDFVPAHGLALSTELRPGAFGSAELSRDGALAYLRREPVDVPPDTPRGYLLATYCGLPLGFMKNLGTRTNNLYPKEWRIRMSGD